MEKSAIDRVPTWALIVVSLLAFFLILLLNGCAAGRRDGPVSVGLDQAGPVLTIPVTESANFGADRL